MPLPSHGLQSFGDAITWSHGVDSGVLLYLLLEQTKNTLLDDTNRSNDKHPIFRSFNYGAAVSVDYYFIRKLTTLSPCMGYQTPAPHPSNLAPFPPCSSSLTHQYPPAIINPSFKTDALIIGRKKNKVTREKCPSNGANAIRAKTDGP